MDIMVNELCKMVKMYLENMRILHVKVMLCYVTLCYVMYETNWSNENKFQNQHEKK
jgi:hypothetical protein